MDMLYLFIEMYCGYLLNKNDLQYSLALKFPIDTCKNEDGELKSPTLTESGPIWLLCSLDLYYEIWCPSIPFVDIYNF